MQKNSEKVIFVNDGDKESIEVLYDEMVRLNDEIFKLADFKLNKANNIIIFDGAIIAVLVLYPLEILVSSDFLNPFLILFIVPNIYFSFSLFNAVNLVNFPEFRVIDSEMLLNNYWNHDKYEILNQITVSLARFIKINQGSEYIENGNILTKKETYDLYLDNSLNYIKKGVISLLIIFVIIFSSFFIFSSNLKSLLYFF